MIGSTLAHTPSSNTQSSRATLAAAPTQSDTVSQVATKALFPPAPSLSIPEILITPPPDKISTKPSKRERFKASFKQAFHKSEGSLLPAKTAPSPSTASREEKPKLSKRERLSQLFTSDKSKAQVIYFEENHPLLETEANKKPKEEKPSKRKRLSQRLKSQKQLSKELYYGDDSPPPSLSTSKPRPQSTFLPKNLNKPLGTPTHSHSPSSEIVTSLPLHPHSLELPPSIPGGEPPPPPIEAKQLESPENTPPGSFQELLRQNTPVALSPANTFSFFKDREKKAEDPLVAEARAFRENRENYSIQASLSQPSSLFTQDIPKNPCCQTIIHHFQSYLNSLSTQSLPSLPNQGSRLPALVVEAPQPLPPSVRSSQNSRTEDTITVDLDHYKLESPIFLKQVSQFAQELVKYSGLVGDLVALGKHTWVLTHTHASMTLYLCPRRIQCRPHTILTSIIESKRSNTGLNYKEVNTQTLKNARKLSTAYTLAYAKSIRKNLHWKSTLAKFIGSCVAVSGIFVIFLSNTVEAFNPTLAFSLYGYYLLTFSIAFFALTKCLKVLSSHSFSCQKEQELSLYRELSKASPSFSSYGSIHAQSAPPPANTQEDLQRLTLHLIESNFDFALRHLLESLKTEQERPQDPEALFPQVLADPSQHIHNPEGSVYMFLKATLGLKKYTLNLLLKAYKKDPAHARRLLQELLLDTKLLTT